MDFIEKIKDLAKRIEEQKKIVTTEQAAKTAMVMPFLQLLGYDVFTPQKWYLNISLIGAQKRVRK